MVMAGAILVWLAWNYINDYVTNWVDEAGRKSRKSRGVVTKRRRIRRRA
jgi:hypothetical protein